MLRCGVRDISAESILRTLREFSTSVVPVLLEQLRDTGPPELRDGTLPLIAGLRCGTVRDVLSCVRPPSQLTVKSNRHPGGYLGGRTLWSRGGDLLLWQQQND
jgi:hypothetical protein